MRPIKFRVWDKQKNQYFDIKNSMVLSIGNTDKFISLVTNQGLYEIPNTNQKDLGWDRWILQQFTGLLDINGKEIYEGDIVKFNKWNCPQDHPNIEDYLTNGYKQIVYGLNCGGQYPSAGFTAISLRPTDLEDGHQLNWMDTRNIEIIGNIFENSELLENK